MNFYYFGRIEEAGRIWFESARGDVITLSADWGGTVRWIRQWADRESTYRVVARHFFDVRKVRFVSRSMMEKYGPAMPERDLPFPDPPRITGNQFLRDTVSDEMMASGNALLADIAPLVNDDGFKNPARLQFESYDAEILTLSAMSGPAVKRCYECGIDQKIILQQRRFQKVSHVRILSRSVYPFTEQREFEATKRA